MSWPPKNQIIIPKNPLTRRTFLKQMPRVLNLRIRQKLAKNKQMLKRKTQTKIKLIKNYQRESQQKTLRKTNRKKLISIRRKKEIMIP